MQRGCHLPQEEVVAARHGAANIHDFIMGLPNGYETIAGEPGYRLSAAKSSVWPLARVIPEGSAHPQCWMRTPARSTANPRFLIQEALKRVMVGRTSIVIAHRLSTIQAADLILVMDRGQIVERGTHQELLEKKGLYAALVRNTVQEKNEGWN